MDSMDAHRNYLKSELWGQWQYLQTDQRRGVPPPLPEKPCPEGAPLLELVAPEDLGIGRVPLIDVIRQRKSHRQFTQESLNLEELSFLLWATQGLRERLGRGSRLGVFRTVPSAGARQPFETYLIVNRVEGLEAGLYRYLSLEHQLCFLRADVTLARQVADACNSQPFVGRGAVVFVWTAIPYRTEWRYSIISPKLIAIDVGHVCQNLYLAAGSIGAGTCAVGAYDQSRLDELLGVDGRDEFAIYVAPVGRVAGPD